MNFDHFANVPKNAYVRNIVQKEIYYNPNSGHYMGQHSLKIMNKSINIVKNIFPNFNNVEFIAGGGTFANIRAILENTKIKNTAISNVNDVIMISSIEHSSISKKIVYNLNAKGYTIVIIPVDNFGIIDIKIFEELLKQYQFRTILISCILANNEIGTIQPINEIKKMIKSYNKDIIFHSDCSCNFPLIFPMENVPDIVTFSCYKFGGPHFGILLTNVNMKESMVGTPDVENMYFCSLALQEYIKSYSNVTKLNHDFKKQLKNTLYEKFKLENIEFIDLDTSHNVDNILSFILCGIKASLIQQKMSEINIAIGSGSACSTNMGSHTLLAIGYNKQISQQLIRLSFDLLDNTIINLFVDKMIECVKSADYVKQQQFIQLNKKTNVVIKPSLRKEPNTIDVPKFDINSLKQPCIQTFLLSYAELSLKGKNINKFINKLKTNIKNKLKKYNINNNIQEIVGKCIVTVDSELSINDIVDIFKTIPGISVITPVEKADDLNKCVASHFAHMDDYNNKTFSIRVKIENAKYNGKAAKEWEYFLGKMIKVNFGTNVDLNNPNITINVYINRNIVYVGTQRISGMGGLPMGCEDEIIFIVNNNNTYISQYSISEMYKRGITPIVLVDSENSHKVISEYMATNIDNYVVKKVINYEDEIQKYTNVHHIIYEISMYIYEKYGK